MSVIVAVIVMAVVAVLGTVVHGPLLGHGRPPVVVEIRSRA
jgi:hypothetical protein